MMTRRCKKCGARQNNLIGLSMIKWIEDLKKAPKAKPILVKENKGLFSGGWDFHKAIRVHDEFFNLDLKTKIQDPHSWAEVNL